MRDSSLRPLALSDIGDLRYGENAQQTATFFTQYSSDPLELGKFLLEEGKLPSYTNLTDLHRSVYTLTHVVAAAHARLMRPTLCAVAVKHGNPCGGAHGHSAQEALEKTILGDTLAIFGGIVATNFFVGMIEAQTLLHSHTGTEGKRVLDMVIAPGFSALAIELLKRKEGRCMLVSNPTLAALSKEHLEGGYQCRSVRKGYLVQDRDTQVLDLRDPRMNIHGERREYLEDDLAMAAAFCRTSNSNTITLLKDGMLLGQGVAQTSRVRAAEVAVYNAKKSGHKKRLEGSVAVSDSFFPFPDGVQVLAKAGVKAIFSTSGSVRDEDVRKYCKRKGIALYQLPDTSARMFFGH
jgi:phosphoribosylaminoimidazolecarboxamide formyltransferase/IMP cyclohydrolase